MPFWDFIQPGTARKVGDTGQAITDTLAADSPYWQTGDLGLNTPGSQGNTMLQQAANVAATPMTVNTAAMDADTVKQQAIGAIYADLFRNGGLAEAAQTQAGNADIANSAQGGAAGMLAQIGNSRRILNQTSNVGTQERAQNGQAANQSDFAVAQQNLQKAMLQMQASHATHTNALNAQAVQNYLSNAQVANDQNLFDAASNARSSQAGIHQNANATAFNNALNTGMAALGAGAAAAMPLISPSSTKGAMSPLLSQQVQQAQALTLTQPQTALTYGKSASPFYPGTLQNSYPATPNAWAIPSSAAIIP